MAKWIGVAAVVGFMVAIFWCVMFFVFFTAEPQGAGWALYFLIMLITCPAWFLGGFLGPLIPFANAGIYALVAFIAFKLRESGRASDGHAQAP